MRFYEKMTKSKQPSWEVYLKVQKAVNDKLTVGKLQFFLFIADHFKPLLTIYQTEALMIALLYSDFKKLLY